ncbi:protein NRT1/ PTR FAMILY 4.6 isoform X2 [Diospyros lotus]|nr:protein NRT1/ PTR FAMILY 4.6 isoform X2 [Diospyros lotus]
MLAASFVLGVEILENLAYLASASNLVRYMSEYMHLSPEKSANSVTNFMGTAFLLAILGGFLSDAFFPAYHIFLISALTEFLGLILLTVQARSPSLKPPACGGGERPSSPCSEVSGWKAAMLGTGLYLVALGVGGIKGSLPVQGAEQFDDGTPEGRKKISTFFNYFVFCLASGAIIAVTFVVWIEDNKGWQWGFGIGTLAIVLSIPVFLVGSCFYRNKIPSGSPLTTICKVLLAAALNSCLRSGSSNAIASMAAATTSQEEEQTPNNNESPFATPTESLKFLNKAAQNKPAHPALSCSAQQVEEVKIVLKILPIFASTIILNACLAQLSTFSVHQAASMTTRVGSLQVPPASLPIFPVLFIMILAPIYNHFIVPFARKATRSEMGITHLQRIGVGLLFSILAMAIAALVEVKRKAVARNKSLVDSTNPLPITFFWVSFQYLFLGSADLFTLAGLMEFFFSEAPAGMRSLATSLSWASLAVGYYLSSIIVSVVNNVTAAGSSNRHPWLAGRNLNHYRLDRFYWLMCGLSGLSFFNYLFWARRYKYRSKGLEK